MAKKDQDEIRSAIQQAREAPLPEYTDKDLSPSTVQDVYNLATKMNQDPTLTGKVMKLFSETVEAVPPPDRVKFLYVVTGSLTAIIIVGMVLKALHLW